MGIPLQGPKGTNGQVFFMSTLREKSTTNWTDDEHDPFFFWNNDIL